MPLLKLTNILLNYLIVSEREPDYTAIKQAGETIGHICSDHCMPESGLIEQNQSGFIPIVQRSVNLPAAELRGEQDVGETQTG